MSCPAATFDDQAAAMGAKRRVLRYFRVGSRWYHCGRCDRYHLQARCELEPRHVQWEAILLYVAQGYRDTEISKMLGISPRVLEHRIEELCIHFYALSRSHLTAISIALGIVDPSSFVPADSEEERSRA